MITFGRTSPSVAARTHGAGARPSIDLRTGPARVLSTLATILVEHRKAQAAARLAEQLRVKSDADLARLGIRREDIARHIKERLY